ncbi:MAG: hypothetical protein SXA11_13910 [Cyanobacteriota bacterium]|nr:hypothetical protein [Cyanobacteriota bacterium]
MNWQAVVKSIDELVFQQTGKHLDTLQREILKGVLNGRKYADIAEKYNCSTGHAKDKGYELWQVLSDILGEELNKSNFCATVERLGVANSHSRLVNPVQIGNLNLCPNPETSELDKEDVAKRRSHPQNTQTPNATEENVLQTTTLKTVSKLTKLGLTAEQIAEALDLPLDEVIEAME